MEDPIIAIFVVCENSEPPEEILRKSKVVEKFSWADLENYALEFVEHLTNMTRVEFLLEKTRIQFYINEIGDFEDFGRREIAPNPFPKRVRVLLSRKVNCK